MSSFIVNYSLVQFLHFYFVWVKGMILEFYIDFRIWLEIKEKEF